MPRTIISFAESAIRDLEDVKAWNAEEGVPEVGIRLVGEIFQRVEALAEHPEMGRVVPEFDQSFMREIIHPPFRVVYRRDSQQVRIIRVLRGERLLRLSPGANQKF